MSLNRLCVTHKKKLGVDGLLAPPTLGSCDFFGNVFERALSSSIVLEGLEEHSVR